MAARHGHQGDGANLGGQIALGNPKLEEQDVDELIRQLKEQAGLSDDQARRAAEVVAQLLKDEEKRKKIITAALASVIASEVVTGAI